MSLRFVREEHLGSIRIDNKQDIDTCIIIYDREGHTSVAVPVDIALYIAEIEDINTEPLRPNKALAENSANGDFIYHIQDTRMGHRTNFGWVSQSLFDTYFKDTGLLKQDYLRGIEEQRVQSVQRQIQKALVTLADTIRRIKTDHAPGEHEFRDDEIDLNLTIAYGIEALKPYRLFEENAESPVAYLEPDHLEATVQAAFKDAADGRQRAFKYHFDDGSVFALHFRNRPMPMPQ